MEIRRTIRAANNNGTLKSWCNIKRPALFAFDVNERAAVFENGMPSTLPYNESIRQNSLQNGGVSEESSNLCNTQYGRNDPL